jgi:DNA-binding NtrC family response regulator
MRPARSSFRIEQHGGQREIVRFGRVIGASEPMRQLYPLFRRLAQSNAPVVIEGETGTGKEVPVRARIERGVDER